ncbi:MAG: hypothetical protein A4E65_03101 [Syntrophorhabdus sp. PtaU1.Bin153]|nr:MAG: hypothetical protein A4E65_03101 [Syntrophorhabdus sp. PtaU1.Bin153]
MIKYILKEDLEKLKKDGTRTVMLLNESDLKFWQDQHLVYVPVEIKEMEGKTNGKTNSL